MYLCFLARICLCSSMILLEAVLPVSESPNSALAADRAAAGVAVLSACEGSVEITLGSDKVDTVWPGLELTTGHRISTGQNGSVTLLYNDGSLRKIGPGVELAFSASNYQSQGSLVANLSDSFFEMLGQKEEKPLSQVLAVSGRAAQGEMHFRRDDKPGENKKDSDEKTGQVPPPTGVIKQETEPPSPAPAELAQPGGPSLQGREPDSASPAPAAAAFELAILPAASLMKSGTSEITLLFWFNGPKEFSPLDTSRDSELLHGISRLIEAGDFELSIREVGVPPAGAESRPQGNWILASNAGFAEFRTKTPAGNKPIQLFATYFKPGRELGPGKKYTLSVKLKLNGRQYVSGPATYACPDEQASGRLENHLRLIDSRLPASQSKTLNFLFKSLAYEKHMLYAESLAAFILATPKRDFLCEDPAAFGKIRSLLDKAKK